jgi:hypothetical protein
VLENAPNHARIVDQRDHAHWCVTFSTHERIGFVDFADESRPGGQRWCASLSPESRPFLNQIFPKLPVSVGTQRKGFIHHARAWRIKIFSLVADHFFISGHLNSTEPSSL